MSGTILKLDGPMTITLLLSSSVLRRQLFGTMFALSCASPFGASKMLSRPRPTLPVPFWKRQPTAGAPTFTSKLQRWTSAFGRLAVQHSRYGAQTSGISTMLRGNSSSSARQPSSRSELLPRAAAASPAALFSEPGNMLSEAAEAPVWTHSVQLQHTIGCSGHEMTSNRQYTGPETAPAAPQQYRQQQG